MDKIMIDNIKKSMDDIHSKTKIGRPTSCIVTREVYNINTKYFDSIEKDGCKLTIIENEGKSHE